MKATCRWHWWVRVSGADGTRSKRRSRICLLKDGFMLKHWKCDGEKGCKKYRPLMGKPAGEASHG